MPWRDLPRLGAILWRLVPLVVSFTRDRRRWIRWGGPAVRTRAFHERRARRMVHDLAMLGPAFVKLAQIFATRADLVPEPYLAQLGTLTDQVPPVPWSQIRSALQQAWHADPDRVVDQLDPVPLAAGSLGQVHRARYQGRDVVVKVLRPNVEAVVVRDVRLARAIVNAVYARFPHHHVLGFRVVLDEFDRHVREEMDFEREAMQCMRMRERLLIADRLIWRAAANHPINRNRLKPRRAVICRSVVGIDLCIHRACRKRGQNSQTNARHNGSSDTHE